MRKIVVIVILLLPISSLVLSQTGNRQLFRQKSEPVDSSSQVINQVRVAETQRLSAYVARNPAMLDRILTDNYIRIDYTGRVTNKAQEMELVKSKDFQLRSFDGPGWQFRIYGDIVIITGSLITRGHRFKETDLSGEYKFTHVYVLRQGNWQAVSSHETRINP